MNNTYLWDMAPLQDEVFKQLVGSIVITKYNDQTYRIDDIDWNAQVTNTFTQGNEEVTYLDYYSRVSSSFVLFSLAFESLES